MLGNVTVHFSNDTDQRLVIYRFVQQIMLLQKRDPSSSKGIIIKFFTIFYRVQVSDSKRDSSTLF